MNQGVCTAVKIKLQLFIRVSEIRLFQVELRSQLTRDERELPVTRHTFLFEWFYDVLWMSSCVVTCWASGNVFACMPLGSFPHFVFD